MASKGKVRVKMAMTMHLASCRLSRDRQPGTMHHGTQLSSRLLVFIQISVSIYIPSSGSAPGRGLAAGQGRAPLSSHRKLLKVRKLCSQIILHDLQFALYLDRVTITQHGLIANLEQYRAVSSSVYHFIKQLHFPICSTITQILFRPVTTKHIKVSICFGQQHVMIFQ